MYRRQIEIDPFADPGTADVHFRSRIVVSKLRSLGTGDWGPANINWSALGTVTVAEAERFTDGLSHAVRVAKDLDTTERRATQRRERVPPAGSQYRRRLGLADRRAREL